MTLTDMALYCISEPAFVAEFNRLTGCNFGASQKRTRFERMIDDTAGFSGEAADDMNKFMQFVLDFVYLPLMLDEPTKG